MVFCYTIPNLKLSSKCSPNVSIRTIQCKYLTNQTLDTLYKHFSRPITTFVVANALLLLYIMQIILYKLPRDLSCLYIIQFRACSEFRICCYIDILILPIGNTLAMVNVNLYICMYMV